MCEIKEVLDKLSDIKPYKIKQAYSYKGLYQVSIIIYILFAAVALAYYFYPGKKLGYVLILLYLLVNLMGLLCMIAPAFLEIKHYLFRWKKVTLTELLEEIKHDENNAKSLSFFLNEQLNYTSYWILQKNQRINLRIKTFFGEETAIISLLAMSFTFFDENIGFKNIKEIFSIDLLSFSVTEAIVFFSAMIFLGFSLGAMWIKRVSSYLLYINEIIELALKIKDAEKTDSQ